MLDALDAAVDDVEPADVDILVVRGLGDGRDVGTGGDMGVDELLVVHVVDPAGR